MMFENGTRIGDRYTILNTLDCYGFRENYLVLHLPSNRLCTAHTVRKTESNISRIALQHEAQLLSRLHHTHIPALMDAFETASHRFIVMDYVESKTVNIRPMTENSLCLDMVLDMGLSMCSVMAYLEAQTPPIVHRDIRPFNLRKDHDDNLKLTDFSIACTYRSEPENADTTILGTFGYTPPENYEGSGQIDGRADIFALGATMYEYLTGNRPDRQTRDAIAQDPLLRETPMGDVLLKCLEPDRNKRYQTAAELKAALEQVRKTGNRHKPKGFLGGLFRR